MSISARRTKMARSSSSRRKTLDQQHGHCSITSARARIVGGISRPSAFAVFRFMTSSNFTGCALAAWVAKGTAAAAPESNKNCRRCTVRPQGNWRRPSIALAMRQSNVRYGQIASLWCERRFGQTDRPMRGARGDAIPTAITSEIISLGMSVPQNTVRHIHRAGARRSPKTRLLEFEPNGARRCDSW